MKKNEMRYKNHPVVEVTALGNPDDIKFSDVEDALEVMVGNNNGICRIHVYGEDDYYVIRPKRKTGDPRDKYWWIFEDIDDVYDDGVRIDFGGGRIEEIEDEDFECGWSVDKESSFIDFFEKMKDLRCFGPRGGIYGPSRSTMRIIRWLINRTIQKKKKYLGGLRVKNIDPYKRIVISSHEE